MVQHGSQRLEVERRDLESLSLRLNDTFVDFDLPIVVTVNAEEQLSHIVHRAVAMLSGAIAERGAPGRMFSVQVTADATNRP